MNNQQLDPDIRVQGLTVGYGTGDRTVEILHGIDLAVPGGTCTAIVGESGSGKTTLGRAIAGLLPEGARVGGTVSVDTRVSFMPQDSSSALNPLRTVSWQLSQVLKHQGVPRAEHPRRKLELLAAARCPDPERLLSRYPHELSGGLAQRVVLATVLATNPRVLIADEPTSALDVSTQKQVVALFRDLVEQKGMTLIVITHELRAAARLADRVAVVYHGDLVEHDDTHKVLTAPTHDYTTALVATTTTRPRPRKRPAMPTERADHAVA